MEAAHAGDALGENAYYLLTAVVTEYEGVTQILLRAASDKRHGLNGFLTENMGNLRHLVSSTSAHEIGIISVAGDYVTGGKQVVGGDIVTGTKITGDVVATRSKVGGGANAIPEGRVMQHTEIKGDAEKRRQEEEERLRVEKEELEEQEKRTTEEADKKKLEEEEEKCKEEERKKSEREEYEQLLKEQRKKEIDFDRLQAEQGIELLQKIKEIKTTQMKMCPHCGLYFPNQVNFCPECGNKIHEEKRAIVCFCKVLFFSPMCLQREFELSLYVSQLKEEIEKFKCKESIKTSPIEKITFVEQSNKKFLIIKIISAVCDISPYEREIRFTETINSVNFKILPKITGNFNINIEIYYDKEKIKVFKIPIEIKEKPIEMPLNGLCTIKVTEKQVLYYAIIGTFASILSINLTSKGLGLLFMVLLISYILLKRRPSKIIKEEDFSFSEII